MILKNAAIVLRLCLKPVLCVLNMYLIVLYTLCRTILYKGVKKKK